MFSSSVLYIHKEITVPPTDFTLFHSVHLPGQHSLGRHAFVNFPVKSVSLNTFA